MLLQTNSYIVPKDKRSQHERLMRRFRQALARIGCEHFEVFEQVGPNWGPLKGGGRFVQILRFRDRQHQLAVQAAEKNDPVAQEIIREFCELLQMPDQQEKGLFALGYYNGLITTDPTAIWAAAGQAETTPSPDTQPEFATVAAEPSPERSPQPPTHGAPGDEPPPTSGDAPAIEAADEAADESEETPSDKTGS